MGRRPETAFDRLFYSPMLGIAGGLGILIVGVLIFVFAPQISRFLYRVTALVFGQNFADWISKTLRPAGVRFDGVLFGLFGAAILIIGTVSAMQGL